MHKTWTVIQHEFQVMTSRLAYRIFAGIVPVVALLGLVGIVVFQAVQTEEPPEDVQAGYVDMTAGTDGGPLFTDYRTQGLTEFVPYEDVETATTALLEGDIRQLFVISEDYLETGVVEEVRLGSGGLPSPGGIGNSSSSPLGRFLLSNLFADADPQRAERAIAPVQVQVREIDETGAPVTEGPDFSMLAFYLIVAILLMVSVFMT
ncbi:MAG: hypothetical protein WD533_04465, partial [Dehalococcoidia bacterium]